MISKIDSYRKKIKQLLYPYRNLLYFLEPDDVINELWIARQRTSKSIEHLLIDLCRKEYGDKRRKTRYVKNMGHKIENFSSDFERGELGLVQYLNGLSSHDKEVIRLKYQFDFYYREIGEYYGYSESNAQLNCRNILQAIKSRLLQYNFNYIGENH